MEPSTPWTARALRAGVSALPRPLSVGFVERLARSYARIAVRTRRLPLFRGARTPTARVAGTERQVVEHRFVLKVLNWVDEVRPLSLDQANGSLVEIHGLEHLRAALAERRGVVLVTGHFGFPPAIRAALGATGTEWLTLRQLELRDGALALGTDPWARVRSLRRAREALDRNHACVLLADGGQGTVTRVPFLQAHIDLSLGAFVLARSADCPILPFFAPLLDAPRRLRVEIGAPLPLARPAAPADSDPVSHAIQAFARLYEGYVRRYRSSVYWASRF